MIGTIRNLPETSLTAFAVGATAVAVLFLLRRFRPPWPRALVVVVLGIALSAPLDLSTRGVNIVGEKPTGLPSLTMPTLSADTIGTVVAGAFAVILVGFSESLAAARAAAAKHEYDIDPSQEMIGKEQPMPHPACSAASSWQGRCPKITVADVVGQRTQVASILNSGLILLTTSCSQGCSPACPRQF